MALTVWNCLFLMMNISINIDLTEEGNAEKLASYCKESGLEIWSIPSSVLRQMGSVQ